MHWETTLSQIEAEYAASASEATADSANEKSNAFQGLSLGDLICEKKVVTDSLIKDFLTLKKIDPFQINIAQYFATNHCYNISKQWKVDYSLVNDIYIYKPTDLEPERKTIISLLQISPIIKESIFKNFIQDGEKANNLEKLLKIVKEYCVLNSEGDFVLQYVKL